jgi:sulfite reductase (NADPH) flavoprotein alpha-component
LFEEYEGSVLERTGAELPRVLAMLPSVLAGYCDKARARLEPLGWYPMFRAESMVTSEPPRSMKRILVSTPYWLMELDVNRSIVFLRRSAEPVISLMDLVTQNDRIIAQISRNPGASGIVVDMRQAPGRNDIEFEQAMRRLRTEVSSNYERVAVLLVSAAGVLQVSRLGRDDNAKTLVTLSEEAAVSFAMGLG